MTVIEIGFDTKDVRLGEKSKEDIKCAMNRTSAFFLLTQCMQCDIKIVYINVNSAH